MPEPINFSVAEGTAGSDPFADALARLRREIDDLTRLMHRSEGARPVVLWLPDTRDPACRARLTDQCRRLAHLTSEEEAMAAGFELEAAQTPGWR